MPNASASHVSDTTISTVTAAKPSQPARSASGRNHQHADGDDQRQRQPVRITAPATWPISTELRAIAMVRNLLMMPSLMSLLTAMAVTSCRCDRDQDDPGHQVVDVPAVPCPRPDSIAPPKT